MTRLHDETNAGACRLQVAVLMQVLVNRFRHVHLKRTRNSADVLANGKRVTRDVPAELVPLMKGAWIGKPHANARNKRRFFQLSSDGSTLRWAWDKYILLYYVEVGASLGLTSRLD